jgi:uncharacterized membrane protein YkoI
MPKYHLKTSRGWLHIKAKSRKEAEAIAKKNAPGTVIFGIAK